jgi:hypothetical protein
MIELFKFMQECFMILGLAFVVLLSLGAIRLTNDQD